MRRIALCIIASIIATGCASLGAKYNAELARTWEESRVFLPNVSYASIRPNNVPSPARPLTTVLYLHGCTGITGHDRDWAQTLATSDYAVVMPNSFAREYRPKNCDSTSNKAGWFPQVHDMRQEEIAYALERLRELPWVDKHNIFLMGHSEGGLAVARWRGSEFRGHIISGWTCTDRSSSRYNGIWAPAAIPVLAITFQLDPWYTGTWMDGSCETKFHGRKNARQITLQGRGHNTASQPIARDAVLGFLRKHTVID